MDYPIPAQPQKHDINKADGRAFIPKQLLDEERQREEVHSPFQFHETIVEDKPRIEMLHTLVRLFYIRQRLTKSWKSTIIA